jgi:hypothetical protein
MREDYAFALPLNSSRRKDINESLNSHAKCNAGIDRSCDGSEV